MFKANLKVHSATLSLQEIEGILGAPSDAAGYSIGDHPRPQMPAGRSHSVWVRALRWADGTHPGTAGLEEALRSLSPMTQALQAAGSAGCDITVAVHQELDPNDEWELGIHLSSSCLAWMAEVGASLDVDQYLDLE